VASPWFTLAVRPNGFKLATAQMVRFLLPGLLFRSNLDATFLSRDPAVIEQYLHDPLVHNSILPKLFFEIEQNGLKASRSIFKINIPLLVMHGTADQITSCRKTRDFVMNAGKLTTFKEWPGAFHELHNEPIEQEVFTFLLQWLHKQTMKS
jgi:alpha-beta hydrolase superfamily lysophospholipase